MHARSRIACVACRELTVCKYEIGTNRVVHGQGERVCEAGSLVCASDSCARTTGGPLRLSSAACVTRCHAMMMRGARDPSGSSAASFQKNTKCHFHSS